MTPPGELSSERWHQIERVFFAALDYPAADLDAFLLDACAGDSDLYAEVTALLDASDEADGFLETLDAVRAAALVHETAAPEALRVGPYAVVREVGRGGMGVVYLAERAARDEKAQFEQQVALKLIKRGMDSDAILRRFLNERQILARLQHPHVARLLDGGVTDDGQPYLAMEYVVGTPITAYCDAHTLDIDARLRLFEDACHAVQYAHQNLVVHRDLKPSNILVTDGGRVKLLDFGIAKLLGADETTEVTQTSVRVMTPEYAAPEQVRGEPVTTATDVYALGVVLFELLTGHRPYHVDHRTADAIERAVLHAEPLPPSTTVSRVEDIHHADGTTETLTLERISAARGTLPARLIRRLAGDLDTIVLKALCKEPERRYASAEAFLEDIRRHLAGLPVTARRATPTYRARAFVRRHRVGVGAAALVVVALAIGLGTALWQARETAREAAKAEEVKSFVLSLFKQADPDLAQGAEVTVRDMLDQGAARVEAELVGQPEVQAEMLEVLGHTYYRLGHYDTALSLLQQALTLRRNMHGSAHPDIATVLNTIGQVRTDQGHYEEADSLLRQALVMRRTLLGEEHLDVAQNLNDLAMTYWGRGAYSDAEPLLREALALRRTLLGNKHPDVAQNLNDLALVLQEQGDFETADPLYREALAAYEVKDRNYATTLNNLAYLIEQRGDYETAERFVRESLALREKLLGDEHPDVAESLNNLAFLLKDKNDYATAEPLLRRVLAMDRKALGEHHPYVAISLDNLAEVLTAKGNLDEALPLYEQALAIHRQQLGATHPSVATSLNKQAITLVYLGHPQAAQPLLQEALTIYRSQLGPDHPYVAATLNNLAWAYYHLDAYPEADSLYRQALAMGRAEGSAARTSLSTSLVGLSKTLLATSHPSDAEPLLREALTLRDQTPRLWPRAEARATLGACLAALARYPEAEALLQASLTELGEHPGLNEERVRQQIRTHFAVLYTAWGKPAQAAQYR